MVTKKKTNIKYSKTAKRKTTEAKPVHSPILSEKTEEEVSLKEVQLKPPFIVKNLADALNKKPSEIIKALMTFNVLASINQTVDVKVAEKLCESFGISLVIDKREIDTHKKNIKDEEEISAELQPIDDNPEDLVERPPVVTFLGHVDHGKTSIQDAIRKTNIVKGEAGGITQHTGASVTEHAGKKIVFIDTPGHEAFTAMRARGANTTDIAILVVAADDGFMPQTIEAMNHAKAAGVPIIVAINKIDLPSADPGKVLLHMQQNNLMSEDWGGEVGTVKVSAITGEGLNDLLERISLEAELLELKANPKRRAEGVVIEAELESGMGVTANLLVQKGTLKQGDVILCGQYYGKAKAIIDSTEKRVKSIGPSMPVKILGLSGVPTAGAKFIVCKTEKEAAEIAKKRGTIIRTEGLTKTTATSLEDLFVTFDSKNRNDLNIVLKTDVQGTAEAIIDSLAKLPSDKIKVNVIHSAVGSISDSDILLASASGAIVTGFHVKVNKGVNDVAKNENVEIRLYSIIYELIEDITDALEGRLAPDAREKQLGKARILKIFTPSKGPKICGCLVEEGNIKSGAKARVRRGDELIFNGTLQSLRRFQDDVKEVKTSQECGIRLDNFLDFQEGDIVEVYEVEFKKAKLS